MIYDIQLQKIYDSAQTGGGTRILVDRRWLRGLKKNELLLQEWFPDIAPSANLRRSWRSGEMDETSFIQQYRNELDANRDCLIRLMGYARLGRLILLTAEREPRLSHLPALRRALLNALDKENIEADACEQNSPTCYSKIVD